MDNSVARIAEYAHALQYADLPAAVVHQCKRCIVDSIGTALGGYDAEPCRIARGLALRASADPGSRIIGTRHRALPELAAFANGVFVRYLDGNDSYLGGGGHPSDCISAILAAADVRGCDGRQIITAVALAYEVYYNFWKTAPVRHKGVDNSFFVVIGSAVGAAKILGLNREQITETLSLAITPNVPLDSTRYGHLSMWKGCAAGNSARNGLFAALLAASGMTGPDKPIEGDHGLHNLFETFELMAFGGGARPFGINEVTLKRFFAVAHALSPITVALELHKQVAADEIEKVTLFTYKYAWNVTGREKEKWRPATREAADHSLPFIVAAVLVYGYFSDELFSDKKLRDERILNLIDRVEVAEDPELTRQFGGDKVPCRIEIQTKSGARKVAAVDFPRGHYNNPMSDDEVNAKFRELAQRALPKPQIERALDALWKIETSPNLDAVFSAVEIS